jgi:hypothetical protein
MNTDHEEQGPLEKVQKESRASIVRKLLGRSGRFIDPIDGQPRYMTAAEAVANALLAKALSGDIPAIRETLDSAYGKIAEEVRASGETRVIFEWANKLGDPVRAELPEHIDGEVIEENDTCN